MSDLLHPDGHLVVGLGDDTDGSLRVYLDARYTGIHTHVDDADAKAKVRGAWGGAPQHLTTIIPRTALCDCPETTEEMDR